MHLKMKLLVRVIEARNIPALDSYGFSCPFVKLKLGKQKYKTKAVKKSVNPTWCEEFSFRVDDLKEELKVYLLDEDRFCRYDFVGIVKLPLSRIFDGEGQSLSTTWYTLKTENKKAKIKECGKPSFFSYQMHNLYFVSGGCQFLFVIIQWRNQK